MTTALRQLSERWHAVLAAVRADARAARVAQDEADRLCRHDGEPPECRTCQHAW